MFGIELPYTNEEMVKILLLPAGLAAVVLFVFWLVFKRWPKVLRHLLPVAVTAPFLVAWVAMFGWPDPLPRSVLPLIFHIAIAWTIIAIVPLPFTWRIPLFAIAAAIATTALLRPLFSSDFKADAEIGYLWIAGIALVGAAWYAGCAVTARHLENRTLAIGWLVTLFGTAMLIGLSRSSMIGMQASMFAGAWAGAAIVICIIGRIELGSTITLLLCGVMLALLTNARFFPVPPMAIHHTLLALAAPLMPWLIRPRGDRRTGIKWNIARIGLTVIPLLAAIAEAAYRFQKENVLKGYDY